jgi:hypothetical protein
MWWLAFQQQAPRIEELFSRHEQWDLAGWMQEHLGAIDPALMWEFGPAVRNKGYRLVITPESKAYLRPLVRSILARQPSVPNWEFYEYRLAEDLAGAEAAVTGRTGGALGDLRCEAQIGDFNRVDLSFAAPSVPDRGEAFNVAFVATESLLGEETLDRWIGGIDIALPEVDVSTFHPAGSLRSVVGERIAEIRASLPATPWHELDLEGVGAAWSSFEIEPKVADHYPDQSDLFALVTPAPNVMQAVLSGGPFDSARFSRFGETFGYIKLEGRCGPPQREVSGRADLENAINAAIRPMKLGCSLGGGTGRKHTYIELALADVDAAWPILQRVLAAAGVPRQTWLLFHDATLATQWRGVYNDAPAPPMRKLD